MALRKTAGRKKTAPKKAEKTKPKGAAKPKTESRSKTKPQSTRAARPQTRAKTKAKGNPRGLVISSEERYHRVQEAAYLLAEKDGFRGEPSSYWLAAEEQVQRQLEED